MNREPVFLVGAERSGTTLLRLMLDHHPQIAFLSEFEYAVDSIAESGQWPSLEEYYRKLEIHRGFLESGFEIDRGLRYPELVASFLEQKRARDGKPVVGATVHKHFDKLRLIWPSARYVHLIRDGRDVARSVVEKGWAGHVWVGVDRWIVAELLWKQVRSSVDGDRWIEIRYEDLILDPQRSLEKLCGFAGVSYDPSMFDYVGETTYGSPDRDKTYQWRRNMGETDIQLLEARIGDMLEERGYELSGLPRIEVSPLRRLRLRWRSRWSSRCFRIRRYGWSLFLRDALARRLGLTRWARRLQLAKNAVDLRHLKR